MQKSVCGCEYMSGIFQKREEGKKKIRNHRNHSYIKGKGIFKITISHFTIINNASIKAKHLALKVMNMEAIFTIMNSTSAVVKILPLK